MMNRLGLSQTLGSVGMAFDFSLSIDLFSEGFYFANRVGILMDLKNECGDGSLYIGL